MIRIHNINNFRVIILNMFIMAHVFGMKFAFVDMMTGIYKA